MFGRIYFEKWFIDEREPSYSIMGHLVLIIFYCLNLWYTFKAYWNFRKYGGIKGFRREGDFDDEEAWKKVTHISEKGSKILDRALDK